jgi:hypothetical protein
MANQYPMSFNYPGPFNLKGTPGSMYILQADDAGNLYVVAGGGGEGNLTIPTVAGGVVFATDTAGDLNTSANALFDGTNLTLTGEITANQLSISTGGNASGDDWAIESDGSINFSNGNFQVDASGNATVAGNLGNSNWEITEGGAFNTNSNSATIATNGSATFAANNFSIDANGNTSAASLSLPSPSGELNILTFGKATFVSAASVVISDSSITSNSIITVTEFGTTPLVESFSVSVTAGTGFTIHSSNATSTAVVSYIRIN